MIKSCRIILLIVLGALLTVGADAQLRYGFRFGGDFAKATLGNSNAISDNSTEGASLVNRSGFSGGLVLEYQFEKCGFAPDIALLYTRYNTRLSIQEAKGSPYSFGRNFIEVPIHLKWKFWLPQTNNLFAPMIYTGASMMFRLDHNSGISHSIPFKTNVFQPGWDVGIGFDIINFIQINAGYRFGLGDALHTPDNLTLHTNAWNVAATLLFDF